MAQYCALSPDKGRDMFLKLKSEFGYDMAWDIWGIVASNKFREYYKDSLELDSDGIPTYDAVKANPTMRKYISNRVDMASVESRFAAFDDTLDGYNSAISQALEYNRNGDANDRFVAIVERGDGNVVTRLVEMSDDALQQASEQAGAHRLKQRLADILAPLGVTYDILTDEEARAGRAGVTDFTVAKNVASDSVSMIRVANNMEGAEALSEEFCHVIVRALEGNTLLERARTLLRNDDNALRAILGDDYDDVVEYSEGDMDLVTEEALGQMLRNNLLRREVQKDVPSPSLMQRTMNWIRAKFKGLSSGKVTDALAEAETVMGSLARDIMDAGSSTRQTLGRTKTADLQMDAMFNSLSKTGERCLDIIKKYTDTKMKEYKMKGEIRRRNSPLKALIDQYSSFDADTDEAKVMEGVVDLTEQIASEYETASMMLQQFDYIDPDKRFRTLVNVRNTLREYADIIQDLHNASLESEAAGDDAWSDAMNEIRELIGELHSLSGDITGRYMRKALPMFAEFMKQYIPDDVVDKLRKNLGKEKYTIEDMITTAEKDISFMDYFLDSMAHSSNLLLQGFGKAIDRAKTAARLTSLEDARRIQALRQEAEEMGITSYEWMFERYSDGDKTGNYISDVNQAQFQRDLAELDEYLDNKYGKEPNEEDAKMKLAERREWLMDHAAPTPYLFTLTDTDYLADEHVYHNSDYDALSGDEKYILGEFLKLKKEFDELYPHSRMGDPINEMRAIQMRKDGVQRFIDMTKDPSTILSNIKEHIRSEFVRREDDNDVFGERTTLTDFDGKEFMTLPVLYVNRLKNPDDLTTDVFGSLIAYASAANEFDELSRVVDALETGRNLVTEHMKIKKKAGTTRLVERITAFGKTVENDVNETRGSNIEKKLNRIFESQVYGRYMVDQGAVGKVDINKATSFLIKMATNSQLAFNFLAQIANVTNGVAMTNIEAASGQYFNFKELLKADGIYVSELGTFLSELESRTKTGKLALFSELFNIKNGYDKIRRKSQRKSLLSRFFSESLQFLGQDAGDHWLYHRVAIANALHTMVHVPGEGVMSLWEAIDIVEAPESDGRIMKAVLPEGMTYEDGTEFNIGEWSKKVWDINSKLFGVYNSDDMFVAKMFAQGRLVMLYRNWIKPQFNKRYQKATVNLITGEIEEGFYRTTLGFIRDLHKSRYRFAETWDSLDDNERANVRRAAFEIVQILALTALLHIDWDVEKKKRPWRVKLAQYLERRLYHETAVFIPWFPMAEEAVKTVKSPSAVVNTVMSLETLLKSMVTPEDWTTEVQSGKFKGWTKFEKALYKAPIPVLNQYRQVYRFTGDLDDLTNYLARPYTGN